MSDANARRINELVEANIKLATELDEHKGAKPQLDQQAVKRISDLIHENTGLQQAVASLQKTLRAILDGTLDISQADTEVNVSIDEFLTSRCIHVGPWERVRGTDAIEQCKGCGATSGK